MLQSNIDASEHGLLIGSVTFNESRLISMLYCGTMVSSIAFTTMIMNIIII